MYLNRLRIGMPLQADPTVKFAVGNEALRRMAEKHGLETTVVDAYGALPPVSIDSEAYRLVETVVGEVFPGLPTCPYVMTGGTDARFYQQICDACIRFSPVVYGPEQMKGMHGLNENIGTNSLPGAVDFYKTLIGLNR